MDTYERIDELLKERHMSRRKLAQIAGININTMSALFMRRPETFPPKYLEKIAAALNVPVTEFTGLKLISFPGTVKEEPVKEADPLQQIVSMLEKLTPTELKLVQVYAAKLEKQGRE